MPLFIQSIISLHSRELRHPIPKNHVPVTSTDSEDPFNFLVDSVDPQHVCVRFE
jgi:hypothetical protein